MERGESLVISLSNTLKDAFVKNELLHEISERRQESGQSGILSLFFQPTKVFFTPQAD